MKDTKNKGWLAPSIQHKLESHIRFIEKIRAILPVSKVIVEVANFDIEKIKNHSIKQYLRQKLPFQMVE